LQAQRKFSEVLIHQGFPMFLSTCIYCQPPLSSKFIGALEIELPVKRHVGSNPTPSAILQDGRTLHPGINHGMKGSSILYLKESLRKALS